MEITVQFPEALQNQTQQVCFELNDESLTCVYSAADPVQIPIEIPKTSILKILVAKQLVLEKEILVQSLAPKKKRRRVRNPWSFF